MTGWHVGQPNTVTCPRQNDTWTNAELTRGPMANLFTHKWLDRWTNQAMTRVIKRIGHVSFACCTRGPFGR
jgi:hypothetical protein